LTVRFRRNRRALAAIALTTDTSTLTAVGTDFGFEHLFSRQIEALCRPGDVAMNVPGSSFLVPGEGGEVAAMGRT
jgi:D-sedoheptulose 7-phosphate isomerase